MPTGWRSVQHRQHVSWVFQVVNYTILKMYFAVRNSRRG
jgi:hypothetical protein